MVHEHLLDFESIRPYEDQEIQSVFNRLKSEKSFLRLLGFLYPQLPPEQFMDKLMHLKSIRQFQEQVISAYVKDVIKKTTKGVTVDGLKKLNKKDSYLFISNHRDIVLDPAILNVLLFEHGFNTTEIAIGDNLLIYPWITDLVKLNRTFIVKRNLPIKQMMESSRVLSSYIRYTLSEKKHSIWIAQREGRSKDGNDRTQISLLKMLNIAGKNSLVENFKELKIVPVSISYEFDPCDYLKAMEFLNKRDNASYQKTKQDDLMHMATGLRGRKGRVHFAFGQPLDKELDAIDALTVKNDQFSALADLIDRHVHLNYKLWPGNYVALDMLNKSDENAKNYTGKEKLVFLEYLEDHISRTKGADRGFIYNSLLEMYANPVVNQRSYNVEADL
ncbi:1-acyl-sn-glycerol-3-phosphate acyltransferase [Alkalitalea saponilacus]|uniref:Acyltransferase n=1 Tax=Alkalitalea saponilacus TaxID=889453 RepID=A0A1T5HQR8_9BACT|nr:1-acyl-sn-glycerol-3-phosphate acyltransferase [Alkalitalea saponilacus]ASB48409.1 glycerol acyltransferase [Alkalitalea saponilacus]SKC23036.1 Acyltransferase [Alkalitalea saponilacus]